MDGEAKERETVYKKMAGNGDCGIFCHPFPDAHCSDDYQFLYVFIGDFLQLWAGFFHQRYWGENLYFGKGEFEIYSGYGIF